VKYILVITVVLVMPSSSSSSKLGASQCLVKCTKKSSYASARLSKRVPKGLCTTEGGEGNIDQDGGGHNIDKASVSVGNNDRQVRQNLDSPRQQFKTMVVTYLLVKKFRAGKQVTGTIVTMQEW